jgi:hypothetical protein
MKTSSAKTARISKKFIRIKMVENTKVAGRIIN